MLQSSIITVVSILVPALLVFLIVLLFIWIKRGNVRISSLRNELESSDYGRDK